MAQVRKNVKDIFLETRSGNAAEDGPFEDSTGLRPDDIGRKLAWSHSRRDRPDPERCVFAEVECR